MRCFFWIVKSEQESLLSSVKGVSVFYVLPTLGQILPEEVAGAIVFVVLRGNKKDVLYKKLYVKKVEQFIDEEIDFPKGSFLLTIDLLYSVKISDHYVKGVDIEISKTSPIGLTKINNEQIQIVKDLIQANIQQRFTKPSEKNFIFLEKVCFCKKPQAFATQLLKELVKNYSLEFLWGSIRYQNPFLNFAVYFLKIYRRDDEDKVIHYLRELSNKIFSFPIAEKTVDQIPLIDIDFTSIDTACLYARKFMAGEDNNFNTSMMKTEDAEKRHQDILRDICEYFISNGYQPKQSNSVDLALSENNKYVIFEIKTTDSSNIVTQSGKGVFQLAMYSYGMEIAGLIVSQKILILESSCSDDFRDFIFRIISSLGIEVLFYDITKQWPYRLFPIYLLPEKVVDTNSID